MFLFVRAYESVYGYVFMYVLIYVSMCSHRYARRKQGLYAEALLDYASSLQLQPNNVKSLNNRG